MNNSMVAHLWANEKKESGESNGMVAVSTMRPPASGLGVR